MLKVKEDKLSYDSNYNIYINKDHLISYSEGEGKENRIYDILKTSPDNSIFSEYLQAQITDWSTEYHFSTYRANILRPISVKSTDSVLEIGAGTGAITRYLVETGADITSVEGGFLRAKSISERCRDKGNLKVICSNIQNIDFDRKFDIITLIGVFEYTPKYFEGDSPFQVALGIYKNLLKENGRLIIAIENQLGLKYFAGYNEDHLGKPFLGIENRYGNSGIKTFGKLELSELLQNNGFEKSNFMYPFPDYKLPKLVLTEEGLAREDFNKESLLMSTKNRHYTYKPRSSEMNETLIWSVLSKNNLLGEFSNSFLVEATRGSHEMNRIDGVLAQYYTCDRIPPYNVQTNFVADSIDIKVMKEGLAFQNNIKSDSPLNYELDVPEHFLESQNGYTIGQNLETLIHKSYIEKDYDLFEELISKWIAFLKDKMDKDQMLDFVYFDCIPQNLVVENKHGALVYIDTEWRKQEKIFIAYPILRYLRRYKWKFGFFYEKYKKYSLLERRIFKMNGLDVPTRSKSQSIIHFEKDLMRKLHLKRGKRSSQNIKAILQLVKCKIQETISSISWQKFRSF